MSYSLQPHWLKYTRLPYPSLSLRVGPSWCPLSWWCYLTISSSDALFLYLQSFPASGSFPMSRLLISGGQSIGASASASVLSMSIQGWFPLGLTGWIAYTPVKNKLKKKTNKPWVVPLKKLLSEFLQGSVPSTINLMNLPLKVKAKTQGGSGFICSEDHRKACDSPVGCLVLLLWSESRSVVSNFLWPHGLYSPWNSPGQNTGMGSFAFSKLLLN